MSNSKKRSPLREGKAKIVYEGPEAGTLIQHFKDDATAFNNEKKGIINGKGVINNRITEYLMTKLNERKIQTHFIKTLNMREQLIKSLEMIPVEVVVRNIAAGSLSKRFGLEEGTVLPRVVLEFYLKNDELNDPMITEDHITCFNYADIVELEEMKIAAIRINDFLSGIFMGAGLRLVDMKLEFGRLYTEEGIMIILGDEISPDTCRLWDVETNEKLDKDRFRRDLGGIEEAYLEVAERLGVLTKQMKNDINQKAAEK